ncbi:MAG TPA: DciA family protein [Stellaceae bacterium]|jgi:hypothetical protein|nr:DciA family protein [Stellaceae bacterium]
MKRATDADQANNGGDSLARSGATGERRPGLRAAGLAASQVAAPIVSKRGGGVLARMKAEWAAVAGAEVAAASWPEALGRGGVLRALVAPVQALELQHRAPLLIERINLYFGRPVVVRIVLLQGPLPLATAVAKPAIPPPAAADSAALQRQLAVIEDTELRAALNRLGRAVIGAERRNR